jgi:hypothetical protein
MGQPRWSDEVTRQGTANRVLILCAEQDSPRMELARPQLELQGTAVEIACGLHDLDVARAALARTPGPVVVAVVVSPAFDRIAARPFIEMVSASTSGNQRLFVLDVRHHPSVVRQCRAFSRALEGLQRTLEIEHHSRGGLTSSASRGATVSGGVLSNEPGPPSAPLRVVHPPVLLAWPLHTMAEVVPATVRFEVPRLPRRASRGCAETRPDLDPMGLPQPWASAS